MSWMTIGAFANKLMKHTEVYYMALEIGKTSTYQNNLSPVVNTHNIGGSNSVDQGFDVLSDQATASAKSTGERSGDNKESSASEQHIKAEISKVNNRLKRHNTKCEFGYHEMTGRVTIKVLDKDTEEVIREIPPEKTLEMIEKMWELAGFLVDERR